MDVTAFDGGSDGAISVQDGDVTVEDGGAEDATGSDASASDADTRDAPVAVDAGPTRSRLQLEFTRDDDSSLTLRGVTQTRSGDYIVYGSAQRIGYFIARLSVQVDVIWANSYFDDDESTIWKVEEHSSGDLIVAGVHSSDSALLMRLRADGTPVWRRTYGWESEDHFESFTMHPDGYIAAGGESRSLGLLGVPFVVRVNDDGSVRGAFSIAVSSRQASWSTIANGPGGDLWVSVAAQLGSGDTTPMMIRVTSADTVRTSQELDWGTQIVDIEAGPTSLTLASPCSVGTTATSWCLADYEHDETGITTGGNVRALPLRPVSIQRNDFGEAVYAGRRAANLAGAPRVYRTDSDGVATLEASIREPSLNGGSFVAGFAEPDFTTVFFDRRFVVARFDSSGSAGCLSTPVTESFRSPPAPAPDTRAARVGEVMPTTADISDTITPLTLVRNDNCPP